MSAEEKILKTKVEDELNVNAPLNDLLMTPLHKAAAEGNLEKINNLVLFGADVNCYNHLGCTPLHHILILQLRLHAGYTSNPPSANLQKLKEVANLLLERGADVNARDIFGRTPLFYASVKDYCVFIKSFPSTAGENEKMYKEGILPLHDCTLTIKLNDEDFKRMSGFNTYVYLEEKSKGLNKSEKNLSDPFMTDVSMIYALLECGANITIQDYDQRTVFCYNLSKQKVAKTLVKAFVKMETKIKGKIANQILERILSSNFARFYHESKLEIAELRSQRIWSCLTFYDILTMPINMMAHYIEKKDLIGILKSLVCKNFKIYGDWLEFRIGKAMERRILRYAL